MNLENMLNENQEQATPQKNLSPKTTSSFEWYVYNRQIYGDRKVSGCLGLGEMRLGSDS